MRGRDDTMNRDGFKEKKRKDNEKEENVNHSLVMAGKLAKISSRCGSVEMLPCHPYRDYALKCSRKCRPGMWRNKTDGPSLSHITYFPIT